MVNHGTVSHIQNITYMDQYVFYLFSQQEDSSKHYKVNSGHMKQRKLHYHPQWSANPMLQFHHQVYEISFWWQQHISKKLLINNNSSCKDIKINNKVSYISVFTFYSCRLEASQRNVRRQSVNADYTTMEQTNICK